MSEIGHNNPPAHEAFSLEVDKLFEETSTATTDPIKNDEQEAALDVLLDELQAAKKGGEAQRKIEKKPHDDAAKAVQANWVPSIKQIDAAIKTVRDRLTPYRNARQKAKDEAAQKARLEAERIEQEARDKLKGADDLEERFEAEVEFERAGKLKAAANKIDREATGLRTYKVAKVTDYRAALLWIAGKDRPTLDAFIEDYARRFAPTRQMDGVTVSEEKRVA